MIRAHSFAVAALAAACVALALSASAARAQSPRPHAPAVGRSISTAQPAGPLHALQEAYRARDIALFTSLLTSDYRYHFYDETGRTWNLVGFTREKEIRSASCLFGSEPGDTLCPKEFPPADSIALTVHGTRLADDPEHPDSTEHYALVIAEQFVLHAWLPSGMDLLTDPSTHAFHVVRGDVAHLTAGQPADSLHWYIRRWVTNVTSPGPDGPPRDLPSEPTPAGVLALRPLPNPTVPDLPLCFTLPEGGNAELAVYDVQGRRCIARTLRGYGAGEHTLAVGSGAQLRPGLYWARLTQPGHGAVTRMITVR